MSDKIVNFYDKLGINKTSNLPTTWDNHHIYNNSMIICLGGTGSGKSNALVNYIARSSGEFYKIIVYIIILTYIALRSMILYYFLVFCYFGIWVFTNFSGLVEPKYT